VLFNVNAYLCRVFEGVWSCFEAFPCVFSLLGGNFILFYGALSYFYRSSSLFSLGSGYSETYTWGFSCLKFVL